MSVLVGKDTRLLVQGMGKHGTFHAMGCREYGTNVVGGVTPGKGGQDVEGIPVFDSWAQAMQEVQPNTAMIFVPCKDGLSHNEAESATIEHCAAGAQVLLEAALTLDAKLPAA